MPALIPPAAMSDFRDKSNNDADETALFRETMRKSGVRPLASPAGRPAPPSLRRPAPPIRRPAPPPLRPIPRTLALAAPTDDDDAPEFFRPGLSAADRRRFQREQIRVDPVNGVLDLHGERLATVDAALRRFLAGARGRCVRIIHGKGHGAVDGRAVLKPYVAKWLRQCDAVLAFRPAPRAEGGSGALHVLLKSSGGASHRTS